MGDEQHLEHALRLARMGRREAHPNPRVGAVVVSGGSVVGEGYHRGPGTPHAEAAALAQAGPRARGATLYVTLEPCCHQGRTGPCTEAIIAAGVARVVAGTLDPNPKVDGRGMTRLREAGVDAELAGGELPERCRLLNRPFERFIRTGLPFVTYKAAVSLDGKVAAAGGDARWISSAESRRRVHAMRAAADAVVVGAGTLRRDDPLLTVRDADGPDPARVVVTRSGELPLEARLLAGGSSPRTVVLATAAPLAGPLADALSERGVEVVPAASLRDGFAALAARGWLELLFEGGPTLAGALLTEGLIDRVALFVAPLLVGRGAPDLVGRPAPDALSGALRLEDVAWTTSGDDLLCEARVPRRGEEVAPRRDLLADDAFTGENATRRPVGPSASEVA